MALHNFALSRGPRQLNHHVIFRIGISCLAVAASATTAATPTFIPPPINLARLCACSDLSSFDSGLDQLLPAFTFPFTVKFILVLEPSQSPGAGRA
jgi:hypothetical protein